MTKTFVMMHTKTMKITTNMNFDNTFTASLMCSRYTSESKGDFHTHDKSQTQEQKRQKYLYEYI